MRFGWYDIHYGLCQPGYPCAKVYQMHRGRHTEPGLTYYSWYVGTHTMTDLTTTKFDLDFPWTSHNKFSAAYHEVLTMLGITYRWKYWQDSCMYESLSETESIRPAARDITNLHNYYVGVPK